jgi:pSer/pThr/pTyr-binding forkhead associated (FHA) protein
MNSGETIELAGVSFLVGRDAQCSIAIDNPRVSRRHARLHVAKGRLHIEDLQSANGTLVNGKLIRSVHCIDSGDVVTVGGVSFLVIAPEAATGMTVISSRLPEASKSFIEDHADDDDTWVSQAYALPPGWSDVNPTVSNIDVDEAGQRLSKLLIRQRIATEGLAGVLFAVSGPPAGTIYPLGDLNRDVWLLGRGSDCEPRIDDVTVSRHHARLLRRASGWALNDLGTTNGCAVNGTALQVGALAPLKESDLISLGSVRLLFRTFD